eukprot:31565-Pelagococcus_subviridis.AAC.6
MPPSAPSARAIARVAARIAFGVLCPRARIIASSSALAHARHPPPRAYTRRRTRTKGGARSPPSVDATRTEAANVMTSPSAGCATASATARTTRAVVSARAANRASASTAATASVVGVIVSRGRREGGGGAGCRPPRPGGVMTRG